MEKLLKSDIEDLNYAVMHKAEKHKISAYDYPIALFISEESAKIYMKTLAQPDNYYIMYWHEMSE